MHRLSLLVIACALLAGCGGSAKKAVTLPAVEHPSPGFAAAIDTICARSAAPLKRLSKAQSGDLTAPYSIILREARQLARLRAPAGEREAFKLLVATVRQVSQAFGRAVEYPDGIPEIYKDDLIPDDRLIGKLERRLHATASC